MPILNDFTKSLAQFLDPAFWGVVVKALALTILLLLAVGIGAGALVNLLLPDVVTIPFFGEITIFDNLASIAAVGSIFLLSGFLMFPVAAVFVGLFLDQIADAVDARHYPDLPKLRSRSIDETLRDAARFAGVFLLVNGVALIIYLVSTLLAPVIFWLVNGYLIGREYFHQVACRRMEPGKAHALRQRYWFRVWAAGVLMAVPLSIPGINLIVPILGVATFTHQVQRLRQAHRFD